MSQKLSPQEVEILRWIVYGDVIVLQGKYYRIINGGATRRLISIKQEVVDRLDHSHGLIQYSYFSYISGGCGSSRRLSLAWKRVAKYPQLKELRVLKALGLLKSV